MSCISDIIFVSVSPTNVQISDSNGLVKKDVTDAYAEGASLTLVCTATGGKPLARVSCFRHHNGRFVWICYDNYDAALLGIYGRLFMKEKHFIVSCLTGYLQF